MSETLLHNLSCRLLQQLAGWLPEGTSVRDAARGAEIVSPYEPPRFSLFEEFLTGEEFSNLTNYALLRQDMFRTSQVISATGNEGRTDPNSRRSRVLFEVGEYQNLMTRHLRCFFDRILQSLQHPPFSMANVEAQITASNDGEYFKTHNDNSHASLFSRELTYVLFFHNEPKAFSGGELRLYESRMENGRYVAGPRFTVIVPRQNMVVFFPSYFMHEVAPVHCSSRNFVDSRFTLNGWIHR
jgi:SM-20-related protein